MCAGAVVDLISSFDGFGISKHELIFNECRILTGQKTGAYIFLEYTTTKRKSAPFPQLFDVDVTIRFQILQKAPQRPFTANTNRCFLMLCCWRVSIDWKVCEMWKDVVYVVKIIPTKRCWNNFSKKVERIHTRYICKYFLLYCVGTSRSY